MRNEGDRMIRLITREGESLWKWPGAGTPGRIKTEITIVKQSWAKPLKKGVGRVATEIARQF